MRRSVVDRGLQVKIASGSSQWQLREQLSEAARRCAIEVVLVWRLDRWCGSVTDLLATLQELIILVSASFRSLEHWI